MSCHSSISHDTCYMCKGKPFSRLTLADGCSVPICSVCDDRMTEGKKLAQERGLYDPSRSISRLPNSSDNPTTSMGEIGKGDNIMQIPEPKSNTGNAEGLPYIGKKTYQEKNVKHIKILDEAVMIDTEWEGKSTGQKPQCTVETDVEDPKKCVWQMNKATTKYMIEKHTGDSTKWIGVEFDIKLARTGNQSPSIYPKDLSLEETL